MRATNNDLENARFLAAYFHTEDDLLGAVVEARSSNLAIYDVYTPFPVHGMDEAMGLKRSRLTWVGFAAGALGLTCALALQIWTSTSSWALVIGGKPFNSFPLFMPVNFEVTVLFSGLITLGTLFARHRLYPFSQKKVFDRVTDDRFVLVLSQTDAAFNSKAALDLLARHHAIQVVEGDYFV